MVRAKLNLNPRTLSLSYNFAFQNSEKYVDVLRPAAVTNLKFRVLAGKSQ